MAQGAILWREAAHALLVSDRAAIQQSALMLQLQQRRQALVKLKVEWRGEKPMQQSLFHMVSVQTLKFELSSNSDSEESSSQEVVGYYAATRWQLRCHLLTVAPKHAGQRLLESMPHWEH